jgi:hypothetical protein
MPILGIYASQISGHLFAPSGAYDSIATVTVGAGGTSTVTFSSIPSTYQHLQIRFLARGTASADDIYGALTFNGVGGTAYAAHELDGNGSTVGAQAFTSRGDAIINFINGANRTSGVFTAGVMDILDYANTNKNKTIRHLVGYDNNGSGNMTFQSGLFANTSAISSATIGASSGNFAQYSSFALYGIKGS